MIILVNFIPVLGLPMNVVEKMFRKNVVEKKFLDLTAKIIDRKIFTDLHIKATDRHQYLYYTLLHPYHTKRSTVYSHALPVVGYVYLKMTLLDTGMKLNLGF